MFTRQPANTAKTIGDIRGLDRTQARGSEDARAAAQAQDATPRATPPPMTGAAGSGTAKNGGTYSIIGNDLTIVGQGLRIISRGTLQVEGKVEGDVIGHEVIIGEQGQVTGVVSANTVTVHGAVAGTVKGVTVALKPSARVEGDVYHQQLSVDQGALLEGRVRRPADIAELTPNLE